MYLCICHAVKEDEIERHHLIGTKCGKCLLHPLPEKKQKKFNKKYAKMIKRVN